MTANFKASLSHSFLRVCSHPLDCKFLKSGVHVSFSLTVPPPCLNPYLLNKPINKLREWFSLRNFIYIYFLPFLIRTRKKILVVKRLTVLIKHSEDVFWIVKVPYPGRKWSVKPYTANNAACTSESSKKLLKHTHACLGTKRFWFNCSEMGPGQHLASPFFFF